MKITSRRALTLAILLLGSSCLTGIAAAATLPSAPPPPPNPEVDANGVDLVTGAYSFSEPVQASIGPASGGLARYYTGTNATSNYYGATASANIGDNYVGTINLALNQLYSGVRHNVAYVTLNGKTDSFNYTGTFPNAVFTSQSGGGSTLSFAAGPDGQNTDGTYIYTTADGTVAVFAVTINAQVPVQAAASVISMTRPTGEQLTWTYQNPTISGCTPSTCLNALMPVSVTSNLGWQLKYTVSGINVTNVTLSNASIDYCNPTALSCSYSQTWPTVNYATTATSSATTTTVTDALNRTTTYTVGVGSGATQTTIRRPSGATTTVKFDSTGRVTSVSNGIGTWNYAYGTADSGDPQVVVTDPNGNTRTVVSNALKGWIETDTDGLGYTTTYGYDSYGRVLAVSWPEGGSTSYTYDARGNVTQTTFTPKGGSGQSAINTYAGYDATCANPVKCNKPNYTIDGNGNETDYTYDPTHGGVTTMTLPAPASGGVRPQVRYTYSQVPVYTKNSAGSLVQTALVYALTGTSTCQTQSSCAGTSDESKTTTVYQTTNLLPYSVTAAAGDGSVSATTSITYDSWGDKLSQTGPLGSATTINYSYDLDRETTLVTGPVVGTAQTPFSRATRFSYTGDSLVSLAEAGTVSSSTFTSLQQVATTYDAADRAIQQAFTASGSTFSITQTSYDAGGRVTCTATRMTSSAFGSLPSSACTQSSGGIDMISAFSYDADNQLLLTQTGVGTSVVRNALQTTYGQNGETTSVKDANGNLTTYAYDGFNRVASILYPSPTKGAGTSNASDYEAYTYDGNSNVLTDRRRDGQTVTFSYDNLNRVKTGLLGTTYAYDNLNRLTSATLNGASVSETYNALGQHLTETTSLGTIHYQYDAANRQTQMKWADGFYVNYGYDNASDLTTITDSAGTNVATYSYDNLGRRAGITRGNNVNTTYSYDNFSNLSSLAHVLNGNTAQNQTINLTGYSPAGQILSRTASNDSYAYTGATSVNRGYTINGLNQATTSGSLNLSYDGRANLSSDSVNTYSYDVANRLIGMSNGASLSYDALGRLAKTVGSTTTQFVYDGNEIAAEYNSSGGLVSRYIRGPGVDEPIAWYAYATTGSTTGALTQQWLVTNEQGSVIAVTNSSGAASVLNSYDDYGTPGSNNTGRFQYTGQAWIPEIGMYDYKARIYSPSVGRFLQTDPMGYGDGLNIYAYVHGDPVNGFDPTGTDTNTDVGNGSGTDKSIDVPPPPPPQDDSELLSILNYSGPPGGYVIYVTGKVKPQTKPTVASCLGAAAADKGLSIGLDIIGAIPVVGNATSATVGIVRAGITINHMITHPVVAVSSGLYSATSSASAGAEASRADIMVGAGSGVTGASLAIADVAVGGTKALPIVGNAVSLLTLGWDSYMAYKKYQECMAGH